MRISVDTIRQAYETEEHDRPVTELDEIPTSYKAVTPEWLTKVLCRDTPGAVVTEFTLGPREALLKVRQQLFPALAMWTITLCPTPDMPMMQPASASLEFIGRMGTAIDDYNALGAF